MSLLQQPGLSSSSLRDGGSRSGARIVVLGFMFRTPVAGIVWQTLHYLLGLRQLGFDPYYLECHGQTVTDAPTGLAARSLQEFGMGDRWSLWEDPMGRATRGLSASRVRAFCRDADAVINLSAYHALHKLDLFDRIPRRVYLETDPAKPQIRLSQGDHAHRALLDAHTHHFTFGQNLGAPDCLVPATDYGYRPTRQPVVLDLWDVPPDLTARRFTTLGKWRQKSAKVLNGERYLWSKHSEFLKFLDLPRRSGQEFELALSRVSARDHLLLRSNGWRVVDALAVSNSLQGYRTFIHHSRGEFTVAKDLNVRLRSGWFSDRSACYLASGRPVITQDTGFAGSLPVGEGLFSFRTVEDVLTALEAVNTDYARHSRAARDVAAEYFDARVVLSDLLSEVGLG